MSHRITIVDDDTAFPEGHDFVFVTSPAGAHIFYRRSELTEETLEDSWAAYRALARRRPPQSPASRPHTWAQIVNLAGRTG